MDEERKKDGLAKRANRLWKSLKIRIRTWVKNRKILTRGFEAAQLKPDTFQYLSF